MVVPDFGAIEGTDLESVIGALLMGALIVAVLMLIVSAIIWAVSAAHGNPAVSAKARGGVLVALGGAVLAGAGVAWMNWLIDLGQTL